MKKLYVYYSRKGYVESIALKKAREEGADFLEIETLEDTLGWSGFLNCVNFYTSKKEMKLFPYDEKDLSLYDEFVICTPVWCGGACLPILEFLNNEKDKIKNAKYIIVHALPSDVSKAQKQMDEILNLKDTPYIDIQCAAGKVTKEQNFGSESD